MLQKESFEQQEVKGNAFIPNKHILRLAYVDNVHYNAHNDNHLFQYAYILL